MEVTKHCENFCKEYFASMEIKCSCGCVMKIEPKDILFRSDWQRNIAKLNSGHIYCPDCFERIDILDKDMPNKFYNLAIKWFETTWEDR